MKYIDRRISTHPHLFNGTINSDYFPSNGISELISLNANESLSLRHFLGMNQIVVSALIQKRLLVHLIWTKEQLDR